MASITSFRGVSLGRTQSIYCGIPLGEQYAFFSEYDIQTRPGLLPVHRSTKTVTREIPIIIRPGTAAGSNGEVWFRQVLALFDPDLTDPGMLRIMHEGVAMEAPAFVRVELHPETLVNETQMPMLKGTVILVDPHWRAVTPQTDSVSPIVVGGNRVSYPVVTLKPTATTAKRIPITFTDVTGRGLVNHWIRVTLDTTGVSASTPQDFILFDRLMSVPFFIQGYGTASTKLDLLLNLLPFESLTMQLVCGSSVNNTITANMLDPGGFDLAHASFSNTAWIYRDTAGTIEGKEARSMWQVSRAINRPGVWHKFKYGAGDATIDNTDAAASASVSKQIAFGVVTQIKTAASNALQGMDVSDTLSAVDGGTVYKVPKSYVWQTGTITRTGTFPSTTTDDIQIPGVVVFGIVAVGLPSFATLSLKASSVMRINLDASEVPTIVVGTPVNVDRVHGTLTNTTTGYVMRFNDLFIDRDASGGLIVDFDGEPRVRPSLSTSPMLWPGKAGFQVGKKGWPLVVGSNAWTWSGDATTVTIQQRDAYAV